VRRSALAAGAALLMLAACSSSGTSTTPGTSAAPPASTTSTVPPPSTIAWSQLHNPLYGEPDHAVKDPALVAVHGEWVLLFSQVDTHGTWRVGIARSHDLATWQSAPALPHDPQTDGEASPDVVREPNGTFVVTYQSFVHDRSGGQAKLYARTTTDFTTFSAPIRLLANVLAEPTDRLIDPALVYSPAGLLLGFKVGTTEQHFEMARSATGTLAGPWTVIGRPDISVYGDTIENYEFLTIGEKHALLATSNVLDKPQLFLLAGAPGSPSGWLHWSSARELVVPQEAWNPGKGVTGSDFEHANCAFLVGSGARIGGYSYLVYGDSAALTSFGGAGHAQFGLARSADLVHWSVPPG
jgi:hypothetical protein